MFVQKGECTRNQAKFPHSPTLHYTYSPLLEENNSVNNVRWREMMGSADEWCVMTVNDV